MAAYSINETFSSIELDLHFVEPTFGDGDIVNQQGYYPLTVVAADSYYTPAYSHTETWDNIIARRQNAESMYFTYGVGNSMMVNLISHRETFKYHKHTNGATGSTHRLRVICDTPLTDEKPQVRLWPNLARRATTATYVSQVRSNKKSNKFCRVTSHVPVKCTPPSSH